MAITRLSEFRAADDQAEALYAFLKSLRPFILNSPGCLGCEVLRDTDDFQEFVVIERWNDVESHQKSVATYPQEQMQAAMSMIAQPPRGRYLEGSGEDAGVS